MNNRTKNPNFIAIATLALLMAGFSTIVFTLTGKAETNSSNASGMSTSSYNTGHNTLWDSDVTTELQVVTHPAKPEVAKPEVATPVGNPVAKPEVAKPEVATPVGNPVAKPVYPKSKAPRARG